MIMTDEELLREYKGAKKKTAQIAILADLNMCTKDDIKEILERLGVPRDELYAKRGRKKSPEKVLLEAAKGESAPAHTMPEAVREALSKELICLRIIAGANGRHQLVFERVA